MFLLKQSKFLCVCAMCVMWYMLVVRVWFYNENEHFYQYFSPWLSRDLYQSSSSAAFICVIRNQMLYIKIRKNCVFLPFYFISFAFFMSFNLILLRIVLYLLIVLDSIYAKIAVTILIKKSFPLIPFNMLHHLQSFNEAIRSVKVDLFLLPLFEPLLLVQIIEIFIT